jgi:hypothetical protein
VFNCKIQDFIGKEQIELLVSSFINNYKLNFATMQTLMREQVQLEREIMELYEVNQDCIVEKEINFTDIEYNNLLNENEVIKLQINKTHLHERSR